MSYHPTVASLLQEPSMDQLIRLSEPEALRRYLDSRNCQTLFRLLLLFSLAAVVGGLLMIAGQRYPLLLVTALNLVVIRLLYLYEEHPVFTRHFRTVLVAYFLLQAALLRLLAPLEGIHILDILLPLLLLAFRLPTAPLATLLGVLWAVGGGRVLLQQGLDLGGKMLWGVASRMR